MIAVAASGGSSIAMTAPKSAREPKVHATSSCPRDQPRRRQNRSTAREPYAGSQG